LSVLTALGIADALTALGVRQLGLKWPNDLFWQGRKLGGILLEAVPDVDRGSYVVIGIGLNVRMPVAAGAQIDQPWTDLEEVMAGNVPSRNLIAARLLDAIVPAVNSFERGRRDNLRNAWHRYDALFGKTVELRSDSGVYRGKALGINSDGHLVLECEGRMKAFACGEVSMEVIQ
jgi:BirA family biotin operon repressor/biotin-[acetyl-CoA-carboxylase] ligase